MTMKLVGLDGERSAGTDSWQEPRRARAEVSVTVDAKDFVRAVQAVIPHAGGPKATGGAPLIRMVADVGAMRVALVATDGEGAAAVAVVAVLDADDVADPDSDDDIVELDLTPESLKLIPAVFSKTEADRLSLDVSSVAVQVTDVSGLLVGRTVRVRAATPWHPEFDGERRTDGAAQLLEACSEPLAEGTFFISADRLRPWTATAKALGGLPGIVTAEGHLLVTCGDPETMTFLGVEDVLGSGAPVRTSRSPAYCGPATAILEDLVLDSSDDGWVPPRTVWDTTVPPTDGGDAA